MDQGTHDIRLSNWSSIVKQCCSRPEGMTAKQWLRDNGINEKTYYYWQRRVRTAVLSATGTQACNLPAVRRDTSVTFAEIPMPEISSRNDYRPDAVIRTEKFTIEISNTLSREALTAILKAVTHAC